ncbi:hypothetical protein KI387_005312, partial [Taxus chinensis]
SFSSEGASHQPFGNTPGVNSFNFQNSASTFSSNPFSIAATNSTPFSNFGNHIVHAPKISESLAGSSGQPFKTLTSTAPLGFASPADFPTAAQSGQTDIWLKDKWAVGE